MQKFSRAYSEGIGLYGEHSTCYAVTIFSREAVLRWIHSKVDVDNHVEQNPFRLLRVRTLSVMSYGKNKKATN